MSVSLASLKVFADGGDQGAQAQTRSVQPTPDRKDKSIRIETIEMNEQEPKTEDHARLAPSAASSIAIGVKIPVFAPPKSEE